MATTTTDLTLDARTLALLSAWFSPACPVGAFSYSHGLETLHAEGGLCDRAAAERAIRLSLEEGGGRADLILVAEAHRAWGDTRTLAVVAAVAEAMAPSAERHLETMRQGEAFATLVDAVWPLASPLRSSPLAHPVAVGAAGAGHDVPLLPLATGYGLSFVANLVSATVRLVPLGQTDGQRITAALAPVVASVACKAVASSLDDIGSATLGLDLASMGHECQEVRLYRS